MTRLLHSGEGYLPFMLDQKNVNAPAVAEFFAGVGLVRKALEQEGFRVVFANDIDRVKAGIYTQNASPSDFVLGDIRIVRGADVPDVDLATASFPCTDLSLAGNRAGLEGEQSGLLWEFLRILKEMKGRRPQAILLENVVGFASSNDGEDLRAALESLNALGYTTDALVIDARRFTPQSRKRLFIVGSRERAAGSTACFSSDVRPGWLVDFVTRHPTLNMQAAPLPPAPPPEAGGTLAEIVDHLHPSSRAWWESERLRAFVDSLSAIQSDRLKAMKSADRLSWATAYRRTRQSRPVWEIRGDGISGCLRTTRGGSSKQAVVEAGRGSVRVRWMTALEYAKLQGAPDLKFGRASENQARFALGDAVCVPVVAWLAKHYLMPLMNGGHSRAHLARG